ncbi:hypothetical protein OG897_23540 [Streptomyces sp. NBC_00237]|uniref:hypothetical protein n=1 Tax=Streptomyces sp. NBC_00237 TaxID=2975687 RepID=UPI00225B6CA2|nr:hypothetical protein [Streptomyces sp. NBC_00237]MCX5204414.1 hypothetical protein [Streptomyces sp. NBC_00237]
MSQHSASAASSPSSPFRRRAVRIGAGVAVLVAVAGYVTVQFFAGDQGSTRCSVRGQDVSGANGSRYDLTAEQAVNAATISSVGTARGMPERAVTIALATALQESALRNIRHGDRDSLGLFQQRPSQGWGTEKQILDPAYSAGRFYQHLTEVPGYSRLPLTVAAQRVQKSGFPQAYAKHEPDAALLASALTGRTPASLTCETRRGGDDGTPGDPAKVRERLVRDFGAGVLPREARGARDRGATAGAGAQDARTLVVPVSPAPSAPASAGAPAAESAPRQRGWTLAHWAMAHSAELRVARITYAGREWRTTEAAKGWQRVPEGRAGADDVRITTSP